MKRKLCAENGSPVMMNHVRADSTVRHISPAWRVAAFCNSETSPSVALVCTPSGNSPRSLCAIT